MQLMNSPDDVATIRANHPGKKIGTYKVKCEKVTDTEISFTDAHIACLQALRDATCEIIILEFVNSSVLYSSMDNIPSPTLVDQTTVLNLCIDSGLDADYILYNSPDASSFESSIIELVDTRLTTEDYRSSLQMSDRTYDFLKVNFYLLQSRPLTDVSVRSYKMGCETLAFEHYIKTYIPELTFLRMPILFYPGTKIPLSTSGNIDDVSDEAKDFANYYYTFTKNELLTDSTSVEASLIQYADGLGGYTISDFMAITDPKFVTDGDVFSSVIFNGPWGSTLLSNRFE